LENLEKFGGVLKIFSTLLPHHLPRVQPDVRSRLKKTLTQCNTGQGCIKAGSRLPQLAQYSQPCGDEKNEYEHNND
jgi:hypothetical protein